ncbi:MAG: hypothetical protein HZB26_23585, partial [Candidatus Hydrogenedentes bacterium]|nr:hypothetical protein [Candidatus Hydrogenedentota bacterium]
MFERRHEPLAPKSLFVVRLARSIGLGLGMVAACLGLGVMGYHFIEKLPWLDALLNASMILSGMGPVN